jgi:hypothetical protein
VLGAHGAFWGGQESRGGRLRRLIEDHALLSDLQTTALVCRGGSIEWRCFPRFDSDAGTSVDGTTSPAPAIPAMTEKADVNPPVDTVAASATPSAPPSC